MTVPTTTTMKVPGFLRWGLLGIGLITAVLGVVMIIHPFTTAKVLAIIIGIELIISGIFDLIDNRYPNKVASLLAGFAGIAAGVLVISWPKATLWVIAIIVGISFLTSGIMQIAAGMSSQAKSGGARGLLLASGVLSTTIGAVALVWPRATVAVLAVLFGLRLLAVGLTQVGAGVLLNKVEVEVETWD